MISDYPKSKFETEELLIQILKGGVYYSSELAKSQEIECPIVTHQYVTKLKNATKLIRHAQRDNCIKFGSEDGMDLFDLNKYRYQNKIGDVIIPTS
ncbi:MAG: hypothetical protein NC253_08925 [Ruminococcus sp.]|nr:hypothetical protein [Ruminococcus sp.]MCM1480113.1 hypothetical protein [Muribaculaceae bacterium]